MSAFLLILSNPIVTFLLHVTIFYSLAPEPPAALLPVAKSMDKVKEAFALGKGSTDTPGSIEISSEHVTSWAARRLLPKGEDDAEAPQEFAETVTEEGRRLESEPEPAVAIVEWVVQVLFTLAVYVLFLFIYKSCIFDKRQAFNMDPAYSLAGTDWRFTTFDCFSDCEMCLYGCCCTLERLADNMATPGVVPYMTGGFSWIVVNHVIASVLSLVIMIIAVSIDANLIHVANLAYYISNGIYTIWLTGKVQEMRKVLGDTNPESKKTMDCICLWCCGCCEIIRHARHIDAATGTKVGCCYKISFLKDLPGAVVVGQPVQAVQATPVQATQVVQATPVGVKSVEEREPVQAMPVEANQVKEEQEQGGTGATQ